MHEWDWEMMNYWNGAHMSGGFMMVFVWILIAIIIIIALRALIRPSNTDTQTQTDPLAIIRERYAKGEIDKKEFDEKKTDLLEK